MAGGQWMNMVVSFILIGSAGYEFSISIPVTVSHPLKPSDGGKDVVNDARSRDRQPRIHKRCGG